MKKLIILFTIHLLCVCTYASDTTQVVEKRIYNIYKLSNGEQINIDATISEDAWEKVEWSTDFTTHFPDNGEPPKRQTAFKLLLDNNYLYGAFKCYHEDPAKLERRMARRDQFPGDWIELQIDSYHDMNTAFSFNVSLSGVKGDEFVTRNGNNWDSNWNPVWYTSTSVDDDGWIAEIKIPLSQLRFDPKVSEWGLNVMRRDFGADQRSTWQWVPQDATGWVSNFGEIHGIKEVKPKRQIEIQPYTLAKLETFEKEEGNPYRDGSNAGATIGLDAKIGLTSDLTLDLTVNPDFGQVEADPSQLNLDGFRIFFDERRPFFVENSNLFTQRLTFAEAGGPYNRDNLFYSRRIGQAPRGSFDELNGAYYDRPDFTSIIAAGKVSGKTKNGLSIGLLETVTANEYAKQSLNGEESEILVEPLTNYFVGRVSQDLNKGASVVGLMFTNTSRKLGDTHLVDDLHRSASSAGASLLHTWKNREWQLSANMVYSRVNGSEEVIRNTQESFEHYYQRPDAEHLNVDESLTSLSGHGGTVTLANYWGKDNLSFQTGFTWRSPGLELNDIGFMRTADEVNHFFWGAYRMPKPVGKVRRFQLNYNHYFKWTYGGEHLSTAFNVNAHVNLQNTWRFGSGLNLELKDVSTKALFGGPKLKQATGIFNWYYFGTDSRKKLRFSTWGGYYAPTGSSKGALSVFSIEPRLRYQPTNALSVSLGVNYFKQNRLMQNVQSFDFNNETKYLIGTVNQQTLSFSARLNYNITPNLTIQYWGQPFISKGTYSDFKYITDPLHDDLYQRFQVYNGSQISSSENGSEYYLDHDMDGFKDLTFGNPDFNFLQFRSNLILRWEYVPGSEFFLVWTQSTTTNGDLNRSIWSSLKDDLFNESINNIFLMKFTYRFLNK